MGFFEIRVCEELINFMNKNYPHLKIFEINEIFGNAEIEHTTDWLSYEKHYESFKKLSRINIKSEIANKYKIERNLPLITNTDGIAFEIIKIKV